ETLEISTAIAGAAVVRNWRMAEACALPGEPLNLTARLLCTKSPNLWLRTRKGACARSHGISPLAWRPPELTGKSEFTYTRTVPGTPVEDTCKLTNTAPTCALAIAERSSKEGFSLAIRVCIT